jgi:hypothetical protein
MARAFSVDLALKSYEDFGCCLLTSEAGDAAAAEFPAPAEIGLRGRPEPTQCAAVLAEFCTSWGVSVLILDGPQAWKDPSTRDEHARVCERLLHTPGKMGLPPDGVLPGPFLPFARFSVALFKALAQQGGTRPDFEPFSPPAEGFLVIESFPNAAWAALGLAHLPAKSRAKADDPRQACLNLQRMVPVSFRHSVNHDEAQALVAGLAGVAVACQNPAGYKAVGAPLFFTDGVPREGYIVLPTPQCLGAQAQSGRARVGHGPGRRGW